MEEEDVLPAFRAINLDTSLLSTLLLTLDSGGSSRAFTPGSRLQNSGTLSRNGR